MNSVKKNRPVFVLNLELEYDVKDFETIAKYHDLFQSKIYNGEDLAANEINELIKLVRINNIENNLLKESKIINLQCEIDKAELLTKERFCDDKKYTFKQREKLIKGSVKSRFSVDDKLTSSKYFFSLDDMLTKLFISLRKHLREIIKDTKNMDSKKSLAIHNYTFLATYTDKLYGTAKKQFKGSYKLAVMTGFICDSLGYKVITKRSKGRNTDYFDGIRAVLGDLIKKQK